MTKLNQEIELIATMIENNQPQGTVNELKDVLRRCAFIKASCEEIQWYTSSVYIENLLNRYRQKLESSNKLDSLVNALSQEIINNQIFFTKIKQEVQDLVKQKFPDSKTIKSHYYFLNFIKEFTGNFGQAHNIITSMTTKISEMTWTTIALNEWGKLADAFLKSNNKATQREKLTYALKYISYLKNPKEFTWLKNQTRSPGEKEAFASLQKILTATDENSLHRAILRDPLVKPLLVQPDDLPQSQNTIEQLLKKLVVQEETFASHRTKILLTRSSLRAAKSIQEKAKILEQQEHLAKTTEKLIRENKAKSEKKQSLKETAHHIKQDYTEEFDAGGESLMRAFIKQKEIIEEKRAGKSWENKKIIVNNQKKPVPPYKKENKEVSFWKTTVSIGIPTTFFVGLIAAVAYFFPSKNAIASLIWYQKFKQYKKYISQEKYEEFVKRLQDLEWLPRKHFDHIASQMMVEYSPKIQEAIINYVQGIETDFDRIERLTFIRPTKK